GNIARTTAVFAPEFRHEEGDIQHVQPVGQDMIAKLPVEIHDGVESDRATDDCTHRRSALDPKLTGLDIHLKRPRGDPIDPTRRLRDAAKGVKMRRKGRTYRLGRLDHLRAPA